MRKGYILVFLLILTAFAGVVSAYIDCTPSGCPSGYTDNGVSCSGSVCTRSCTKKVCAQSWTQVYTVTESWSLHSENMNLPTGSGASLTDYSSFDQNYCYKVNTWSDDNIVRSSDIDDYDDDKNFDSAMALTWKIRTSPSSTIGLVAPWGGPCYSGDKGTILDNEDHYLIDDNDNGDDFDSADNLGGSWDGYCSSVCDGLSPCTTQCFDNIWAFRLQMDADVENSYVSGNPTSSRGACRSDNGDDPDSPGINYVNFNSNDYYGMTVWRSPYNNLANNPTCQRAECDSDDDCPYVNCDSLDTDCADYTNIRKCNSGTCETSTSICISKTNAPDGTFCDDAGQPSCDDPANCMGHKYVCASGLCNNHVRDDSYCTADVVCNEDYSSENKCSSGEGVFGEDVYNYEYRRYCLGEASQGTCNGEISEKSNSLVEDCTSTQYCANDGDSSCSDNQPPGWASTISLQDIDINDIRVIGLDLYVLDPEGQNVSFRTISEQGIDCSVNGSVLTITPISSGLQECCIIASDGMNDSEDMCIDVNVFRIIDTLPGDIDIYLNENISIDLSKNTDKEGVSFTFDQENKVASCSLMGSVLDCDSYSYGSEMVCVNATLDDESDRSCFKININPYSDYLIMANGEVIYEGPEGEVDIKEAIEKGMVCEGEYCNVTFFVYSGIKNSKKAFNLQILYTDKLVEVNITLNSGWNLISVPLQPSNADPSSVFGFYEVLYGFNNSAKEYFVPETLDSEHGYWIKVGQDKDITYSGKQNNSEIEVYPGWNLVPYPYTTDKEIDVSNPIYGFNGTWLSYNNLNPNSTLKKFLLGKAYWIYSNESGIYSFD